MSIILANHVVKKLDMFTKYQIRMMALAICFLQIAGAEVRITPRGWWIDFGTEGFLTTDFRKLLALADWTRELC